MFLEKGVDCEKKKTRGRGRGRLSRGERDTV